MRYIDFHTHAQGCEKYINTPEVVVVQSVHLDESPHPRADYITWGIHPMLAGAKSAVKKLNESPDKVLSECIQTIKNLNTPVIGIGECGWDKRSDLSPGEQDTLVWLHIQLAEKLRLPMVFHIVGGWHHLLSQRSLGTTPWIVHGFRGKPQLADQLHHANIGISLHPKSSLPDTGEYLLETDDTLINIIEHYKLRKADTSEKFNLFSKLFLQ